MYYTESYQYHLCVTRCDISQTLPNEHQQIFSRPTERLEDAVSETLPGRPGLHLLAFAVDEVPVKLTTASVYVHLSSSEPSGTLPEVAGSPKERNYEQRKV
jgi:hypothetical protein